MGDRRASQTFLHALWEGKPEGDFILLWTLSDKRSTWFQNIDEAVAYASSVSGDIYTGVGLAGRDYGPTHRCPSDEITGIAGLWADLDLHSPAHNKPLPSTQSEALALIPGWLQPTYTIFTGNGVQAWLLFKEPWMFDNAQERLAAANLLLRFQTVIASNAKEKGWVFERLADLARIARFPGTFNCKDPVHPKAVEVISNSGPRLNPSELADILDELNIPDPDMPRIRQAPGMDFRIEAKPIVPANLIGSLKEADRTFKATWEQKRRKLKDTSPSGYDLALTNILVLAGLPNQTIVDLLITWRAHHGHPPKLRADYYARTLHLVRSTLRVPEPLWEPTSAAQPGDKAGERTRPADVAPCAAEPQATGAASAPAPAREAPRPHPAPTEAPAPPGAPPPPPPPPPKAGPEPEPDPKVKAAREYVRQALHLGIVRVRKLRGEEPSYLVDLNDARTVEMNGEEFFNQHRFAAKVFMGFDFAMPRLKEVQWRAVLGALATLIVSITRDPELTVEGKLRKFLASYLAEVPFQLEALEKAVAARRNYPLVREGRVALSATHLALYIEQTFHEKLQVREVTGMLEKIGARHYRERIGRRSEQSRWLLPADDFPAEEYVHLPPKPEGEDA